MCPPPEPIDNELVVMSGTMEKDISASTPLARFCKSGFTSFRPLCAAAGAARKPSKTLSTQAAPCCLDGRPMRVPKTIQSMMLMVDARLGKANAAAGSANLDFQ